jgi:predicted ATPase
LTDSNAEAIAALCRQLEGLPLAIELAAARASVLTPAEILAWTRRQLPVLGWDAPDLPPRQQTLRATIAWSYDLLETAEQELFQRLSVFAGDWTMEAAVAVTRMDRLGLNPVSALGRLVDASLVEVTQNEAEGSRFRVLEPLRQFGAEYLKSNLKSAHCPRVPSNCESVPGRAFSEMP